MNNVGILQLLEDPLWSSGHDTRLPNGRAVVRIRAAARRMLLSQKGFEYVTMNPALPAKAVGPQPANVPLRNEV